VGAEESWPCERAKAIPGASGSCFALQGLRELTQSYNLWLRIVLKAVGRFQLFL
jgi:hypothetical protein